MTCLGDNIKLGSAESIDQYKSSFTVTAPTKLNGHSIKSVGLSIYDNENKTDNGFLSGTPLAYTIKDNKVTTSFSLFKLKTKARLAFRYQDGPCPDSIIYEIDYNEDKMNEIDLEEIEKIINETHNKN